MVREKEDAVGRSTVAILSNSTHHPYIFRYMVRDTEHVECSPSEQLLGLWTPLYSIPIYRGYPMSAGRQKPKIRPGCTEQLPLRSRDTTTTYHVQCASQLLVSDGLHWRPIYACLPVEMHDSKSFILTVKVSLQILKHHKSFKNWWTDGLDCAKISVKNCC